MTLTWIVLTILIVCNQNLTRNEDLSKSKKASKRGARELQAVVVNTELRTQKQAYSLGNTLYVIQRSLTQVDGFHLCKCIGKAKFGVVSTFNWQRNAHIHTTIHTKSPSTCLLHSTSNSSNSSALTSTGATSVEIRVSTLKLTSCN